MRTASTPTPTPPAVTEAGPVVFARFAYPPNERGYCGPADHRALLEYGAHEVVDPGLVRLARGFEGAWPYLTFIAAEAGIGDPLDPRVVEAYWIGNSLLRSIDRSRFAASLDERFRLRAGSNWGFLAETIPAGGLPHHAFHVFSVYPWVGMLERGSVEHPLHILDRCRIRWGRVLSAEGETVVVESEPLAWTGRRLELGPPRPEIARRALDGLGFVDDLIRGDWVALHWDWVCERLSSRRLANLRYYQAAQLDMTNRRLAHPGPAAVLG